MENQTGDQTNETKENLTIIDPGTGTVNAST